MTNLLLISNNIPNLNLLVDSINYNTKYYIYYNTTNLLEIIDFLDNSIDNLGIVFNNNSTNNLFFNKIGFFQKIVKKFSIKIVDFLACSLLNSILWKKYFNDLENILKIPIRASLDITGNSNNWILENYDIDIKDLYFNKNISLWNYKLDPFTNSFFIIKNNNLYSSGDKINNTHYYNFYHCLDYIFNDIVSIHYNYLITSNSVYSYNNGLVQLTDYSNITVKILSNKYISAILTNEPSNNLYLLGQNDYGQLGFGNTNYISVFTRTIFTKTITDFCLISNIAVAVLTNETLNNFYISGINSLVFNQIVLNKQVVKIIGGYNTLILITNELVENYYFFKLDFNQLNVENYDGLENKTIIDGSCGNNIFSVITNELPYNLYILENTAFTLFNYNATTIYLTDNNYFFYTINNILYCFGKNIDGSLGSGDDLARTIPVILDLPFSNFVSIIDDHVFIKDLDNNYYTTYIISNYFNRNRFNIPITKISSGKSHTLILTSESINNLYVCGDNANYATCLGINTGITYNITRITSLNKFILDIYAGDNNSTILTSDTINNLWVCGKNDYGQLGLGHTDDVPILTNIITNSYVREAKAFSHGYYIDNKLNIWFSGNSSKGQTTNFINSNVFVKSNLKYGIVKADIGLEHTVMLADLPINNIFGVGDTTYSQYCKNSYKISRNFFNKIVKKIGFGRDFGGFITDTEDYYVFGNNNNGQLGIEDNTYYYTPYMTNIKSQYICYGDEYSIIIVGDKFYSSGKNTYGQLGLGDYNDRNTLTPANFSFDRVEIFNNTTIFSLNSTIYGCGNNSNNQLGFNTNTPTYITSNVLDYSIGNNYICIIKDDNILYLQGLFNSVYNNFTPTLNNCKLVRSSINSIYVIDLNNGLHVCGDNSYGQLGTGDNIYKNNFTLVYNNVDAVACNDTSSFLIQNGNVFSTGDKYTNGLCYNSNIYLQLINGNVIVSKYNNTYFNNGNSYTLGEIGNTNNIPFQIITGERIIDLSCSKYTTSFLSTTGNLYGCGLTGENGVNTFNYSLVSNNVTELKNYESGSNYVLNSNLYVCGDNTVGEFGVGSYLSSNTFIQNSLISNIYLEYKYPILLDFYFTRPILVNNSSSIIKNSIIRNFDSNLKYNFTCLNSNIQINNGNIYSNYAGTYNIIANNFINYNYLISSISSNINIVEPIYLVDYNKNIDYKSNILVGSIDQLIYVYNMYNINLSYVSLQYITGDFNSLSVIQKLDLINLPENRDFLNLNKIDCIDIQNYLKSKGFLVEDVMYSRYFQTLIPTIGNGTVETPYIVSLSKQFTSKKIGYYLPCMNGEIYKIELFGGKYYYIQKTNDGLGSILVNNEWCQYKNGDMILVDSVYFVMYFTSIILYQATIPCLTPEANIKTPFGYKNVTTLNIGDYVITSDNRVVKIEDIIETRLKCNDDTFPYIVAKNSINREYPKTTIKLSKNHLLFYKGFWIAPFQIPKIKRDYVKSITYYNIKLPNYITDHLIIDCNTIVESYGSLDTNESKYRFTYKNYYYLQTLIKQIGNKELDKTIGGITNHNTFIYACNNNIIELLEYMVTFRMRVKEVTLECGKSIAIKNGYLDLVNYIDNNFT
jgi:alpha-tubulin suppressor-like RCC1 family protein